MWWEAAGGRGGSERVRAANDSAGCCSSGIRGTVLSLATTRLTEATFAITNMLAGTTPPHPAEALLVPIRLTVFSLATRTGVQGVDPMKLLEATDRAVDTQACSAPVSHVEVGFSAAELAAQVAPCPLALTSHPTRVRMVAAVGMRRPLPPWRLSVLRLAAVGCQGGARGTRKAEGRACSDDRWRQGRPGHSSPHVSVRTENTYTPVTSEQSAENILYPGPCRARAERL